MPAFQPNRWPAAVLSGLLVLLAAWAAPALAGWQVEVRPQRPQSYGPMLLELRPAPGQDCPATLQDALRDGSRIDIFLSSAGDCGLVEPTAVPVSASGKEGLRWGAEDVYRVHVYDDRGPAGRERLVGFALVEVGPARGEITPESGFWWNEAGAEFDRAGPGFGLALESQSGLLSASVFGYDDAGAPAWWLGAGAQRSASVRLDLVGFEGGSGPFQQHRSPGQAHAAGVLHLHLLSPARATAWFERPASHGGIELQPLSLVRFRFGETPGEDWLGRWVFIDEPREGNVADAPFSIDFDHFEADADGFVLHAGEHDGRSLRCSSDPRRPNSPPDRCLLRDRDGRMLVDFRQIAIEELRGHASDGERVRALRPTR